MGRMKGPGARAVFHSTAFGKRAPGHVAWALR